MIGSGYQYCHQWSNTKLLHQHQICNTGKFCWGLNTLRLRQSGRNFTDDIFLNENVWILLMIPLKLIPNIRNNNIPELVQIMAWRRPGDKPLSEPMVVNLLMHICVTQPQWVNSHPNTFPQISKIPLFSFYQFCSLTRRKILQFFAMNIAFHHFFSTASTFVVWWVTNYPALYCGCENTLIHKIVFAR